MPTNMITVADAINKVNTMEWSTQKDGYNSLRNANVFKDYYGEDNFMNDVSTDTVREYKYFMLNKLKYSRGTLNRKLASVSKLVTYVKGCRAFVFNWGQPIIEYERTNNRRKFTLSTDVEEKLIRKSNELGYAEKTCLWIFLIDIGCRLSEALKLKWEHIDFQNDFVKFVNTKNGEDRDVPMFKRVRDILEQRRERGLKSPFPFSISSVEWTWRKVRRELGMDNEKDFVIHSLRHTCITRLLKRKIGIETVQLVVGHSDIRMTQAYNHPDKFDIRNTLNGH
tara:strand:- start:1957 stop:2799 length:843 start_codon:yes stop_codon:yes gene_type:complete